MTTPRKAPTKRPAPARPTGVKQPQDHLPPAAQREAEAVDAEVVEIEFDGMTFTVPADADEWPTRVHQAFARGAHIDAIEYLLGPRQWAQFNAKFPQKREFDRFSEVLAERLGFGSAGN